MELPNQKADQTRGHHLYLFGILVVALVFVFSAVILAGRRTSFYGRATSGGVAAPSADISTDNSYVFASPISANADGTSVIRVTVFVLNGQGLGVAGQQINIKTSGPLKVEAVAAQTDNFGRAIFDLSTAKSGNYTISAEVKGLTLPQTVSVAFL